MAMWAKAHVPILRLVMGIFNSDDDKSEKVAPADLEVNDQNVSSELVPKPTTSPPGTGPAFDCMAYSVQLEGIPIPKTVLWWMVNSDTQFTFLLRLSLAMTINKAQGQIIPNVGVYLPRPVFSHDQLYIALPRATTRRNIKILATLDDDKKKEKHSKKNGTLERK
ncbi:uncharacterized protein LOC133886328 [Phragmites australis]|uniref:uncharacterized protein LOC133886328 n=1 Tax=Phragmites australis TaxID=29695 RepID=UPI002D76FDF5|nr:uncharacterized protein LOC133886328 [Phragmites australis]